MAIHQTIPDVTHRPGRYHWVAGWLLFVCLFLWLLAGCEVQESTAGYHPEYAAQLPSAPDRLEIRVGIHPLHNPELLFERYGPIVEALNERIAEASFTLEASRNYQEFENKLASGSLDLAMPNPYQTLLALQQGYSVFGKMANDDVFRGIVLVRRDKDISRPDQLQGQKISFPSSTALAATMMPQYALHQQGLPWGSYQPQYVGSQESSIMNVLLDETLAGATWPTPWQAFQQDFPERAEQLEVLLETPPLINNSWVARNALDQQLVQHVAEVLFSLHETAQGREILAALPLERFEAASNTDYAAVGSFIDKFSRTVRPVDL